MPVWLSIYRLRGGLEHTGLLVSGVEYNFPEGTNTQGQWPLIHQKRPRLGLFGWYDSPDAEFETLKDLD